MTRSLFHKSFAFFFLVLLCLPFIQEKFSLFHYTAVVENRTKVEKPVGVLSIFSASSDYAQKYEKYFNDTYGLRDFFIKLKNQIDYSLFGLSDEVLVGPDGWLFYKKVYENHIQNVERNQALLPKLYDRISKLNSMLKEKGMTLIVMFAPQKTTLYPEFLPAQHQTIPGAPAFMLLREYLNTHTDIESIDVYKILSDAKPNLQLYHKTDFHWTDPAGVTVLKNLIYRMGELSHTGVRWNYPLETKIDKAQGGGEVNSLAVFYPPLEDMLMLSRNPAAEFSNVENTDPKDVNQWRYIAKPNAPLPRLPKTVFFGDSYADAFLRGGFTSSFEELYKFYNLKFSEKFKEIPPGTKFVVFEIIESGMASMINDAYWPEELR